MVLSLPPIPPELKSITPYLQRADELANNDPVISYWCAYYAAQQGIALKVKDSPARHFLFDLLGLLERMKNDIGANDAVHDEPASAAYIENFALRVFAGADNEDRSGNITRNTAKKFLAAANFLELLRIFDPNKVATDLPSIEEKIKYAKWKAADIAKAIREGRKPTAGSAGSPVTESATVLPDVPNVNIVPPPTTPPSASAFLPSNSSPPAITRSTPPPPQLTSLTPLEDGSNTGAPLPDGLAPPQPPQSPGSWSTAATPGTPGFHLDDDMSPGPAPKAFVSGELEGKTEEEIDTETTPPGSAAKSVHFSPSVTGGLETPNTGGPDIDPFTIRAMGSYPTPPQPSAPPFEPFGTHVPSSVPPPPPSSRLTRPTPPVVSSPTQPYPHVHAHAVQHAGSPVRGETTATVTTMPPELSPQIIAQAQKHCRFAISALDYEDSQQAVKELRAALRMLGG